MDVRHCCRLLSYVISRKTYDPNSRNQWSNLEKNYGKTDELTDRQTDRWTDRQKGESDFDGSCSTVLSSKVALLKFADNSNLN